MLLFKPEHVPLILNGRKTQTRRLWKKRRAKPGSIHKCYTKVPFSKGGVEPFARVRILRVWRENLGDITDDGAIAEGYDSRSAYWSAFRRINRLTQDIGYMSMPVWAVEFELVKEVAV